MSHPNPDTRAARAAWIRMLTDPTSRKTTRRLVRLDEAGEMRCCLGHACAALHMEAQDHANFVCYDGCESFLPENVARTLDVTRQADLQTPHDVWRENGALRAVPAGTPKVHPRAVRISTLAQLNDSVELNPTPQEIGALLEQHLEHGFLRPFAGK